MNDDFKREFSAVYEESGWDIPTAVPLPEGQMGRERRMPFETSADPFYSPANWAHLDRGASSGRRLARERSAVFWMNEKSRFPVTRHSKVTFELDF